MLRKKKTSIEKEIVICENCHFQYSYLYEATQEPDRTNTKYSKLAKKDSKEIRKTHANTKDSYQSCPHCNLVQSWMADLRQMYLLKEFAFVAFVSSILVSAGVFYGSLKSQALAGNSDFSLILSGAWDHLLLFFLILGIGTISYLVWVFFMWNPNRGVDQSGCEAAPAQSPEGTEVLNSAIQYEAAAKLGNSLTKPKGKLAFSPVRISISCMFAFLGVLAFLSPSLFPDVIADLNTRGFMMLPFYVGIVCFLLSVVSHKCFSWLFHQKSRSL